jgi:hypothetical protein
MAMLMVLCPYTAKEISTGIETEADVLKQLPRVQAAVLCPVCNEKHFWTCDDAMLAEAATLLFPGARP